MVELERRSEQQVRLRLLVLLVDLVLAALVAWRLERREVQRLLRLADLAALAGWVVVALAARQAWLLFRQRHRVASW
jgi:hypothetical protein